ncbi:hypothetical protein [Metabacillus litoralis]|uniref:hypothetical protein n=1 Tax=Metabacillus litoralis TaxID=152268 RepID=UPI001CFCE893|nr:hypothetical protein [Metabacillus litoralis]
MNTSVSIIFERKPNKWGLRGDPYLWNELQTTFARIPLPCSTSQFIQLLKKHFQEVTNHEFSTKIETLSVEKYSHGGMSSGVISTLFWEKEALPLLINQLQFANEYYNKLKMNDFL